MARVEGPTVTPPEVIHVWERLSPPDEQNLAKRLAAMLLAANHIKAMEELRQMQIQELGQID